MLAKNITHYVRYYNLFTLLDNALNYRERRICQVVAQSHKRERLFLLRK